MLIPIKCELYMEQPEGLAINGKNVEKFVGRLKKTHCTLWNKMDRTIRVLCYIPIWLFKAIETLADEMDINKTNEEYWYVGKVKNSQKNVTLSTCEKEALAAAI